MSARIRSVVVLVGLGLAAALALWLRLPPVARDTLWAEDGRLFLAGAEQHGLARLFQPYAGYLQVVPRLVAAAVVVLPVPLWALGMTAGACLVSGGVAVVVFLGGAAVVPRRLPRLLLAGTTVLLPLGPRDVLGNPTNLHTVLLWGLFWLMFAAPIRARSAVVLSLVGAAFALSEIQTVFLLPLVAWRLLRGRNRVLAIGPALGIVAQVAATLLDPRATAHRAAVGPASVALGYLVNGVVPLAVPIDGVGRAAAGGALWLAGGAVLAAVAGTAVLWRRTAPVTRPALVGALVLGPVVYAASVIVNPAPYYAYATMSRTELAHLWLTRYGVAPGMLFVAVVVLLAATLLDRRGTLPRASGTALLVAVAVCLTAFAVPSTTRRSDGPAWSPQVPAAAATCARTGAATIRLRETLGWRVPVTCARLVGSR